MITISLENGDTITIDDKRKELKKSREGFFGDLKNDMKENSKFMKLWDKEIKPLIPKGKDPYTAKTNDYHLFIARRRKDKSLTAEKFIAELKAEYTKTPQQRLAEQKEKETNGNINSVKSALGDQYSVFEARIKALATEANNVQLKAIANIKSSPKAKEMFGKENINYMKYVNQTSVEDMIKEINNYYAKDIAKNKDFLKTTKLEYTCYLVDIAFMDDEEDKDLYNDYFGDDLYSVFEDCIPNPSAKYDIDIGGFGWEDVTFTIMEK